MCSLNILYFMYFTPIRALGYCKLRTCHKYLRRLNYAETLVYDAAKALSPEMYLLAGITTQRLILL